MIANFGSQEEAQRIYDLAKEFGVPVWNNVLANAINKSEKYVLFESTCGEILCWDGVNKSHTEISAAEFEARMRGEWKEEVQP